MGKVEYFRKKYGENPRSDILGIDGCALFMLSLGFRNWVFPKIGVP